MTAILPYIPPALYCALAFHFWRSRWHAGGEPAQGLSPMEHAGLLAALAAHAIALHPAMLGADGLHFGFSTALSLMLWLAVAIHWLESSRNRMAGLQPLVLPLAAACALLPHIFPSPLALAHSEAPGFKTHVVLSMLAYSLFTLAAQHAVFMAAITRRLHRGALSPMLAALPPLLAMEALLFRLIGAGFALLTLSLASGVLFSEQLFGKALPFTHKTLFALISWIIFAALLAGRHFRGWRGRTAVAWTLAGFAALLLAYVGSHFVLEVLLHRA